MPAVVALLTSRLGLIALAVAAVFVFYEGVPIGPLRDLPYVGDVLDEMTAGRVDRARIEARKGFVAEYAVKALTAQRDEEQRQRRVAEDAANWLRIELAGQVSKAAEDAATMEKEIQDYEQKLAAEGRSCRLDDGDIEWLQNAR